MDRLILLDIVRVQTTRPAEMAKRLRHTTETLLRIESGAPSYFEDLRTLAMRTR